MNGWLARFGTVRTIAGAAIGMAGGFGVLFSGTFSLFLKPISAGFGWSRLEVSLLSSISFLGYGLGGPTLGLLNRRFGAGRVLTGGIVGLTLGLASLGLMPGRIVWFAPACLLLGWVAAPTAPTGYALFLTERLDRRLGTGLGIAMLGLGCGAVVMPSVAHGLIAAFGWRGAYLALAVLAAVIGGIATQVGAFSGPSMRTAESRVRGPVPPRLGVAKSGASLAEALASWRFWLIGVSALAVATSGIGFSVHAAALLSDRGMSTALVARLAGVGGAGVLLGRTGAAVLMDHLFAPVVAAGCFLLGAAGLYLTSHLPVTAVGPLFGAALLGGLLLGCEVDMMPVLTRRYFGARSFSAIYGCIIPFFALGGILGPAVFGLVHDRTGSYQSVFDAAAMACALAGLALPTLGRSRFPAALPVGVTVA